MSEHHYRICFIISKNSEHFVKMSEQPYWMFLLMHCKEMQKIEEELEYPNFVLIAQLQFLIFFRRIAKTLSLIQNTSTGYSCQNQNVELYKLWQDNKNALLRLQLLQILVNSDLASLKRVNTAVHVNVFVTIAEHKYWISLSRLQNNCISFLCHDCSLQNNSIFFLCHNYRLQNTRELRYWRLAFVVKIVYFVKINTRLLSCL